MVANEPLQIDLASRRKIRMDGLPKISIFTFLNSLSPKLCSLASISPSAMPHCSVMGYAVQTDLQLILNTHLHSRKWSDLLINSNVALTFGYSLEGVYLQCEGIAELISIGEEHFKFENLYFLEHPDAIKYKAEGQTGTILIRPFWFRFYNFRNEPTEVYEIAI